MPTALLALMLVLLAAPRSAGPIYHLFGAKSAELNVHAGCDEWSAAHAGRADTSASANMIRKGFKEFYEHEHLLTLSSDSRGKLVSGVALLRPTEDIISAGVVCLRNGEPWSYVIWRDEQGLSFTLWKRVSRWQTHSFQPGLITYLVPQGGLGGLWLRPESLSAKFTAGLGKWDGSDKKRLMIPYKLEHVAGVIEFSYDGDEWRMKPDRGTVERNRNWTPFADK
jgi:hypothetical protein